MIPFLMSGSNLVVICGGNPIIFGAEHPHLNKVKSLIKDGTEQEIMALANVESAKNEVLKTYSGGRATYVDGQVYLDGEALHNSITQRISQFAAENLPFEHLLKFIENIAANPSFRAQQELFRFLEHQYLPITDDGHFLAYKAVRSDYKDKYSGTFDNYPGTTVSVPRNKVDDDCDKGCSYGLHVGSIEYVRGYANGGCDIILVVKVNPADVVSIPKDSNCQKCRTCSYMVLRLFEGELNRPLYDSAGTNPYVGRTYDDVNLADLDDEEYYDNEDDYYDDEDEDDYDEEDTYEEDDDFYDPADISVTPTKVVQETKYGPQLSSKELSEKAKKQKRDKKGHFIKGYKKN